VGVVRAWLNVRPNGVIALCFEFFLTATDIIHPMNARLAGWQVIINE
jgi:hypothetical protein